MGSAFKKKKKRRGEIKKKSSLDSKVDDGCSHSKGKSVVFKCY